MKTMTTASKVKIQKSSRLDNVWGVYDNGTGELAYIGMSRNAAREYRGSFEDNSHLTGPRKINVTARMA